MANYNDSFKASLEAKGYTSSFTDAWNQYLQDNTDIESTVTPDMLAAWLSGKGFTGSVPDMLQQYAESTGFTSHAEQVIADAFLGCYQDVYSFDGVDDRGVLQFRAINPDGDIDIEFKTGDLTPVPGGTDYAVVSQCLAANFSLKEFTLYFNSASGALQCLLGGGFFASSIATALGPNKTYRWTLVGTTQTFYVNGTQVFQSSVTRGAAREPTAITVFGAQTHGGANTFRAFATGMFYDLKINGTLWPISERAQTIQLPSPSGLGAELITQSVLENPFSRGTQWTYLGSGRWQYLGDGQGELQFLATANIPDQGLIDYEVESYQLISGVGSMRISPTNTNFSGDRLFNSVGKKRAYYTVKPASISFTRNTAGDQINCIIKNISFKPLGTCNPLALVNTTAERWSKQEVPCHVYPDPLTPFFTQQPAPQSVAVGATPTFTSDALVGQGPVTYQWQLNTGGGFSDIVGATLKTLTLLPVVLGQNGNQLRVVATANARPVFSISVTLTVTL